MATDILPAPPAAPVRILGMRCRNCGRTEPIGLSYVCVACFGPLEVDYDYAAIGATLTRAAIAGRPPGIWRYAELLPVDARARPRPAGRLHAPHRGRTTRPDARPRSPLDQGRHAEPVAQLQGPRGRGRRGPRRGVRGGGARLRVDRQPGRRDGGRGGRTWSAGLRLHPRRPRTRQGGPRPGLRRDRRPDRGHLRRRQPALSRGRRRDRLGVRQHQPAAVLRRGFEDAGLRDRGVARLALTRRRRRAGRLRGDVHPCRAWVRGTRRAGAHRAAAHPLRRRPGCGLRTGRDGLGRRDRRDRRRSASPTRSSARSPSAIRRTGNSRSSWPTRRAARSRRSRTP